MGHRTIVHGYIAGFDDVEYARLNRAGLAVLPEWSPETYPLVTRDMFALPDSAYLGHIIVFGRSYNGVEGHWQRWREEFEALLRTLYWDEVQVWVETEWWGDFQCSWSRFVPDPEEDEEESDEELMEDTSGAAPQDAPLEPTTHSLYRGLEPTTHWLYRGPKRDVVR